MWTLILTIFVAGGYTGETLTTVEGFNSYKACMDEGKVWLKRAMKTQEYGVLFMADYDCERLA
jgi:hypothetical protein